MKKHTFLLISVLLLSAAWAMAQNGQYRNEQGPTASGRHITVEGCLSQAGEGFVLTDQSGTSYQLTGNTDRLKNHVGHTIRVKGYRSGVSSISQTPGSMSESAAETQGDQAQSNAQPQQGELTLSVSSFKHVSSSCGATQGNASGTGSY